jgi:catechol 2,3-dioxygenase-like lactoylglutathione lyase family enzyme
MSGLRLGAATLVVRDPDRAIAFFTDALGFRVIEDAALPSGKRRIMLEPAGGGARLRLARADNAALSAHAGRQVGDRVAFFLETDDLARDHAALAARGVRFAEARRDEPCGRVAVFLDCEGNRWDLIEPRRGPAP